MAMPFLVTGATGRIGRALRSGWQGAGLPDLQPVWQARSARPGFLEWDILRQPCPDGHASGIVLCLAGGRAAGEQDADLALATLRAAHDQGARHVFVMSSAAVYGRSEEPLTEATPPAPPAPYGRQKLVAEQTARDVAATAGFGLTILRLGNVAGFDALLGGVQKDAPVTLDPVEGQTGGPVRSYIGPASLGRVLIQLAGRAARGGAMPPTLNIASPEPVAMAELLDAAGVDWHYGPDNPDVLARVVLDTAALQRLLPELALPSTPGAMVAEWRSLQ